MAVMRRHPAALARGRKARRYDARAESATCFLRAPPGCVQLLAGALAAAAIFLGACLPSAHAQSADYAREQRWAQEIVPAIVVGEPVQLKLASGRTFLAIHTAAAKPRGAVIVVHGMGVHPDWGLINTLRSSLPEAGYATLSVQMPVLSADAQGDKYPALFPEATDRLRAALAWLRGRGHRAIAIVSHSMGARMSNQFLVTAPQPEIAAWVAIGLSGEFVQPERLRLPVLDLYGSRDLAAVLAGAARRADSLRAIRGSSQIEVSGADHFFHEHEDQLLQWIRRFLERKLPQ
jgi:alpha/beta superfamily hydrolase